MLSLHYVRRYFIFFILANSFLTNSIILIDESLDYHCYDLNRFKLMPRGTDFELILNAMQSIVNDSSSMNSTTCFHTSNLYSCGDPYMEIFFQDHKNNFQYIYSTSNSLNSLSVITKNQINSSDIPNDVLYNDDRFYMWDTTILSSVSQETDEYKSVIYVSISNSNLKQRLDLKAKISVGNQPIYQEIPVIRNTIYIYYPSSIIYSLVDSINKKIYIMQSGTNQVIFPYSGEKRLSSHPLTPENMASIVKYLNLPKGFSFMMNQLFDNSTLIVYSSIKKNAIIMQDNLRNTYQYLDVKYGQFLYDQIF